MEIEFTAQQKEAIAEIEAWYQDWIANRSQQVFFLTGQAGTGKTSIARAAAERCSPHIEYIAPTGKAAARLRQKGCTNARTLHQFAYNLRGEDDDGNPIFWEKDVLNSRPAIVVLDEASMVGKYDLNAVLKHGLPVLALGDLGQLPPVNAPYSLDENDIDFELTEILRQKADSKIIQAASHVRAGKILPIREYDDVRVRLGRPSLDSLLEHSDEIGQILVSRNATRERLNKQVRQALGFNTVIPAIGEKVICTFNQHNPKHAFMNGEQAILLGFAKVPEYELDGNDTDQMLYATIKSLSTNKEKKVKFNPLSFSEDPEVQKLSLKRVGGFTYGYAITVHKSQGSEWENILVIDESIPATDMRKIRYTAYTRAISRLTVHM